MLPRFCSKHKSSKNCNQEPQYKKCNQLWFGVTADKHTNIFGPHFCIADLKTRAYLAETCICKRKKFKYATKSNNLKLEFFSKIRCCCKTQVMTISQASPLAQDKRFYQENNVWQWQYMKPAVLLKTLKTQPIYVEWGCSNK